MVNVLIAYASDYGSTRKMAEAIAQGVVEEGGQPVLRLAEEASAEDLLASDAILLGTPVHMGSPDWRLKKLIDSVFSRLWMKDALVGRVGGVFATGGGFGGGGGGAEIAVLALLNNLAEMGMVLVPLPKNTPGYAQGGLQWGPYARTHDAAGVPAGVDEGQLEAARYHGRNVARVAQLLKEQRVFAHEPIERIA
ncbi:MAG: NAD(P)H-dependent oxidoreductase [Candidatus Hydrogenedentes bacterium]|nr:NAD(P)H-dependent oxidoreductase [Candidatus Hydrogenedentota bacterium]